MPLSKPTFRFSTFFKIALILAAFLLLYGHTIKKLAADWAGDPNFSHGFFIPPIALYMIWAKRNHLSTLVLSPSNQGLFILFAGMLIHLAGHIGAELFMMRFSMIVTICGIVLFLMGWQMLRSLAIPLSYLMLMIPVPTILWNKIAFPLQLLAASLAASLTQLLHIPVFREGNILHLANTSLEVVDACSGLRSLTSLIALTGLFAFLASFSAIKKWILFFSAIPIAVAVNVFRLTFTAAMAFWIGPEIAHGFLHEMSGILIFSTALVLVYLVFRIEMHMEKRQKKS